jgi:hypothetical protein
MKKTPNLFLAVCGLMVAGLPNLHAVEKAGMLRLRSKSSTTTHPKA